MKKRGYSDAGLHHVDAQKADKGALIWPQVGDKVFAKTDERVREFQMATVIELKESDCSIKVRWDSSLDFSWIGRNPKLLQKATPNEKRSRLPVNLYSKGSVRPRRGMISYDERDNDDEIRRREMDIEEENSQENTLQEYSQEDNINDAFSYQAVQKSSAQLGTKTGLISALSSSTIGGVEKVVPKSEVDIVVSNLPVTKTEIEELNESILEIEGKMDSDIRNRLRIGLSRQLQLPLAATAAASSSESGSSSISRSHGGSNGDSSSSSSDSNIVNVDRISVGQSPDKIVVGTTSPLFYPHKELLRFHSLEEVPNFRCRWTEAKESTKVR